MADEFKTLREVGHGIGAVKTEIRLYAAIGVAAFAIAGAVGKFAFDKLDRIEETLAEVKGIVTTIASDTSTSRSEMSDVKNMLASLQVMPQKTGEPSAQEQALIASLKEVLPVAKFANLETSWGTYGDYTALAASLTDEQRQKVKSACVEAIRSPEPFQLYLLGICAAVVNQK